VNWVIIYVGKIREQGHWFRKRRGEKMKLKEILIKRDQLKNHIYALKRAISLCHMYMKDDEMIQDLEEIKEALESEFNELSSNLSTIEEIEM